MLFWNYSNRVYRSEGVPGACLTLQNSFGLDVNMTLFCCWHGLTHGEIDNKLFLQCHTFSRIWSEKTVKPIRNIRIWLKDTGCTDYSLETEACMSYRERIKAIELEAEKIQQITLESYCQGKSKPELSNRQMTEAIAKNLSLYLDAEKNKASEAIINELLYIIKASDNNIDGELFSNILTDQYK